MTRPTLSPEKIAQMRQMLAMMQMRGQARPGMGMIPSRGMMVPGMVSSLGAPGNPGGAAWDRKEDTWDARLSPNTGRVAELNTRNPYITPAIADLGAHGQLKGVKR